MATGMMHGWFGPKRTGWGASPRKWQAWVSIVVYVGLSVAVQYVLEDRMNLIVSLQVALLAAFLGLVYLTYDAKA